MAHSALPRSFDSPFQPKQRTPARCYLRSNPDPLATLLPPNPLYLRREQGARDTERITTDASALESLVFAVASQLKVKAKATSSPERSSLRLPPSPPATAAGDGRSQGRRESSSSAGAAEEEAQDLPPAPAVAVVGRVAAAPTKNPGAAASGL